MTRAIQLSSLLAMAMVVLTACRSVEDYRAEADRVAAATIAEVQQREFGRTEPIVVGSAADTLRRRVMEGQDLQHTGPASLGIHSLPTDDYWDPVRHLDARKTELQRWSGAGTLKLSLVDALQICARNSREYQSEKERVYGAALRLDGEQENFRTDLRGVISNLLSVAGDGEDTAVGTRGRGDGSISRTLRNGAELSGGMVLDLARMITREHGSSLGIAADASITIPLLRGSGRKVFTESLTQAERDLLYAMYAFERFKRTFAVRVARDYLDVLRREQQIRNEADNYRSVVASRRRARRMADAGETTEIEHDRAVQQELQARDRWTQARESYAARLDAFKVLIGLPPDAKVELDPAEVGKLRDLVAPLADVGDEVEEGPLPADAPVELVAPSNVNAGPLEMDPAEAVQLAMENRLDLRTALMRVQDAQRKVYVAMDNLRAELTLMGSANMGESRGALSGDQDSAKLEPSKADGSAVLTLDLPIERTAERNAYRSRLIDLEQAVRSLQSAEDDLKLEVRDQLRNLRQARVSFRIATLSVELAARRVANNDLLFQAGRANIREVLDAQEDLLRSQNDRDTAAVNYRISELQLQTDLGLLQVDADGLWQEFRP